MWPGKREYTTDIEEFLDAVELESEEDRGNLSSSFSRKAMVGMFRTWEDRGQVFVEGIASDVILRLSSMKAQKEFVRQLEVLEIEEEDESEEGFRRAMENPHA